MFPDLLLLNMDISDAYMHTIEALAGDPRRIIELYMLLYLVLRILSSGPDCKSHVVSVLS